ncbi:LamG-like jellyroll fold domain-containing protein [Kibdelosporangium lantanae]|uniref:LamG-like jellyroll fold domain-containing protein n=1 Tax=Kibdelosporangium lantanae TaxID=1497396 RepID=A0ABW3M4X5_9PSEU
MDDDTTDATGNENTLRTVGASTFAPGYSDSAATSATEHQVGQGVGQGVALNRAGYAQTDMPLLDTTASYTVSAWVKLADTTGVAGNYAVAGQDGAHGTPFQLRYSVDAKRWQLGLSVADTDNANYLWATSTSVPQAGVWTHLTGVYDPTAAKASLYVNGVLESQVAVPASSVWQAYGKFSVGRAFLVGDVTELFNGTIDQVQVWNRALPAAEVAELANSPVLRANYQLNGNTNDGVTGATASTAGGVAMVDNVARFDSTATGEITGPRPQDFRGDRSFTVEAWVLHRWTAADTQNATRPDNPTGADIYARAAISMDAQVYEPFMFGYRGNPDGQGGWHGQWSWTMVRETTGNQQVGGWTVATPGTADNGVWTHIAGTYDATTGTMCLYATTDTRRMQPSCTDTVKGWNGDELANLFIGHGRFATDRNYWYGDLRGVRVYSGVLDQLQINRDTDRDHP